MKKVIIFGFIYFLSICSMYSANFINPNTFKGTELEKQQVLSYIKENAKETYEAIGMGDPSTLRMMEAEELKSFKSLVSVENKELLNSVIKQYCDIGMCNYSTISMMYKGIMYIEQYSDSKKETTW